MRKEPTVGAVLGGAAMAAAGGAGIRGGFVPTVPAGATVGSAKKKKKKVAEGGVAVLAEAGDEKKTGGHLLLRSLSARSRVSSLPSPPRCRSLSTARRVTPAAGRGDGWGVSAGGSAAVVEKVLPNGGLYVGSLVGNTPHGVGKKCYVNGDSYEGEWRRNLPEGHGRYVWRNGNQYIGEWRGGVISGRGALIWANGDRYDGQWEGGVPSGSGIFTWSNGSCCIGSFTEEGKKRHQLYGTFYTGQLYQRRNPNLNPRNSPLFFPSPTLGDDGYRHMLQSRKRSSVDSAPWRSSFDEKHLPRICIWESDGEAGDITCDIVHTLKASMLYREGKLSEKGGGGAGERQLQRSPCSLANKPGETISKGHKNYDLMLNLQLGIRYSVGKIDSSTHMRELRQGDFDPREKFWTRFPPEGSKTTPPHQSVEFRWKDYCPMVFRHLRKLFAVDPADYMLAICGDDALRELSSPGKSGSSFYLTQDDRFMIKTVKKSEVKVLIRMLPSYYQHVYQYKNSLLTKFYGVHCVKPVGSQKVRFIVMGNMFCSDYPIHRRFDLKGSSHGRTTDKADEEIDETTTLKDLDLHFMFCLQNSWFQELLRQIDNDCDFLEAEGIMDYSLLVGLHFRDEMLASKMGLSPCVSSPRGVSEFGREESQTRDVDQALGSRIPLIRLGANMPARAERTSRSVSDTHLSGGGGSSTPSHCGEAYDVILYFGIIDILQDYDITKKLEHAYKSLHVDPTSISAVDPKLYSKRFRDFLRRIFVEYR